MSDHFVITFESVHSVLKAEKALKEYGIDFVLIPIPREIGSDCGIALEVLEENQDIIRKIFYKKTLVPDGFHKK